MGSAVQALACTNLSRAWAKTKTQKTTMHNRRKEALGQGEPLKGKNPENRYIMMSL